MRGQACSGEVRNRAEVVTTPDGLYKGVLVRAGQGRYETPAVNDKHQAQTLLEALEAELYPKAAVAAPGMSAEQTHNVQTALSALHEKRDIKRELGHGLV